MHCNLIPWILAGLVPGILLAGETLPFALLPPALLLLFLSPLGLRTAALLLACGWGYAAAPHSRPEGPETLRAAACLTRWVEGRVSGSPLPGRIDLAVRRARLIRLGERAVRGRLACTLPRGLPAPPPGALLRIHGESTPGRESADPAVPAAWIRRPERIELLAPPGRAAMLLEAVRGRVRILLATMPRPGRDFLRAVYLGERQGLGRELLHPFRITGLAHALAVSGFHVALLAGALALVTRRLGRHSALVVELVLLSGYALLTGAGSSILRAVCLFALRRFLPGSDGGLSLAACAVLLLAADPALLHSLAARLSFGACAGILLFTPLVERLPGCRRLPRLIRTPLAVSVGAQLTVIPLLAGAFGGISLIAPLCNLLLLPPFILCCAAGLPACLLAAAGWGLPLALCTGLFDLFLAANRQAAALPGAFLDLPGWGAGHTLLWYALLLLALGLHRLLARRHRTRLAAQLVALFREEEAVPERDA